MITPYVSQAEATLEALRDMEPGGRPLAEVGTAHRFQGREFPIVVFDTVEPQHDGRLWMGQASRLPGSTLWQQKGARLFNVATTRVQYRLYGIASRERVRNARPGTAFGHLGTLLRDRRVRCVPATGLIAPPEFEPANLGPEGRRLAEVLARHVEITDITMSARSTTSSPSDLTGPELDLAMVGLGRLAYPCPAAATQCGGRPRRAGHRLCPGPERPPPEEEALHRRPRRVARCRSPCGGGERHPREGRGH